MVIGVMVVLRAPQGPSQPGAMDGASLQESVEAEVASAAEMGSGLARSQPQGSAEAARLQERVEYIVRDASGKVKERQAVAGR